MPAPIAGVDGNWLCPACNNVNFAVRQECNRCTAPKPAVAVPQQQSSFGGRGGPVAGVDGNWACPSCRNVNYAMREVCNRCQAPKPPEAEMQQPAEQRTLASMVTGRGISGRAAPVAGVDGNWACAVCHNVNFAVREACNRCQTPKQEAMIPPHQEQGSSRGPPVAGVDGNWACPLCNNVNFAVRTKCNICEMPRPAEDHVQPAAHWGGGGRGTPVAGLDGNWACSLCNNVNYAIRLACNRCQAPRQEAERPQQQGGGSKGRPIAGVDGNWECPWCQNVNYAVRDACNRCQAPKPQERSQDLDWALQAQRPAHAASKGGTGRGPVAGVDGNWACALCGNVNYAVREACNMCQAPRQEASRAPQPMLALPGPPQSNVEGSRGVPIAGVDGNWACPQCQNVNYGCRTACNRCQAPRLASAGGCSRNTGRAPVAGVDGNWACPLCRNVNYAMREVCNRCQAPKPEDDNMFFDDLAEADRDLMAQLLQPAEDAWEEPAMKRART